MAISDQDVRHLCKLASLALSAEETTRMAGELEAIVGYVQQLTTVDTTGIEPIANVAGLVNVTRPDVAKDMLDHRQVLANAHGGACLRRLLNGHCGLVIHWSLVIEHCMPIGLSHLASGHSLSG